MNIGSLVTVKHERRRLYILLSEEPRSEKGFSEREYKLFCLEDGSEKIVAYSMIKVISSTNQIYDFAPNPDPFS